MENNKVDFDELNLRNAVLSDFYGNFTEKLHFALHGELIEDLHNQFNTELEVAVTQELQHI